MLGISGELETFGSSRVHAAQNCSALILSKALIQPSSFNICVKALIYQNEFTLKELGYRNGRPININGNNLTKAINLTKSTGFNIIAHKPNF